jgi:hypothetical protein
MLHAGFEHFRSYPLSWQANYGLHVPRPHRWILCRSNHFKSFFIFGRQLSSRSFFYFGKKKKNIGYGKLLMVLLDCNFY